MLLFNNSDMLVTDNGAYSMKLTGYMQLKSTVGAIVLAIVLCGLGNCMKENKGD